MLGYRFAPESIKKIRKRDGLTRYALGNIVGTSSDVVKNWELGKAKPSMEKLCELANKFKLTPMYFFRKDRKIN